MNRTPLERCRWTRKEYARLGETGILHDNDPVELIGGDLIISEPKGTSHATTVRLTTNAVRAVFGTGWIVCVQDPVALDDESEPEPDVMVVRGEVRDYRHEHPSDAALIVEVAESSLDFDRRRKGSLYARAGAGDYWIVNLVAAMLEVHREPGPDASAPFGWRYRVVESLAPPAMASPLAKPEANIPVVDLLP